MIVTMYFWDEEIVRFVYLKYNIVKKMSSSIGMMEELLFLVIGYWFEINSIDTEKNRRMHY
ncbi:hypothetical protein CE91St64_11520 [Faecalicatena contorta]|nr:hypothetical protein CE91St64_11520 [Faecalicatena contorta]